MKIIYYSFFLLIGLHELNGALTPAQINKYQLLDNETKNPALAQKILNIVEEFKKRMCHEIPRLNIPVLDPIKVKANDINLIPNFEISIANLNLKGLSDIQIENLKVNVLLLKFTGQVKLNNLDLMTDYKIKGEIPNLLEIDGKGQLRLNIDINIDLDIRLGLDVETKKLLIKFAKLEPKLTINIFRITGLFPDDDLNKLIEDMVTDIGVELFDDIWEENKNIAIELLQMLASEPVKDMTIDDLLDLIGSDAPIFNEDDPEPNCKD